MNKSDIEQYAASLRRRPIRRLQYRIVPAQVRSFSPRIENVGAILWDVYGTLMALSVGDLQSVLARKETMREAFRLTAGEFGIADYLDDDSADVLMRLYVREIEKTHNRKRSHGVFSPEVRIERVWLRIIEKLVRAGYQPPCGDNKINIDLALKIAYFFDDAYQTKVLYPGARETVELIRTIGLRQGIISNAQFYTPIALNMLLRREEESDDKPLKRLFDRRLVFFSYRLGVSKPNPLAFELARSRLQHMGIGPGRVLYVGNDVLNDMVPARAAGFKCVLFAGDKESLVLHKDNSGCRNFVPDAVIKRHDDLEKIIGQSTMK